MEQRTVWIISTEAEAIRAALESMIDIDVADPYTTHEYSVVTCWGTWWKWWVDGQMMHETWNTFNYGPVGGQGEVKNTCDSAYTRWWDLQYFTPWTEWYSWSSLGSWASHASRLASPEASG